MLYTFEMTEAALNRVDEYLAEQWQKDCRQRILGVQHRITDDLLFVTVECDPKTAVWLELLI